jgi:hypothetical protein
MGIQPTVCMCLHPSASELDRVPAIGECQWWEADSGERGPAVESSVRAIARHTDSVTPTQASRTEGKDLSRHFGVELAPPHRSADSAAPPPPRPMKHRLERAARYQQRARPCRRAHHPEDPDANKRLDRGRSNASREAGIASPMGRHEGSFVLPVLDKINVNPRRG